MKRYIGLNDYTEEFIISTDEQTFLKALSERGDVEDWDVYVTEDQYDVLTTLSLEKRKEKK